MANKSNVRFLEKKINQAIVNIAENLKRLSLQIAKI